MVTFFLVKFEDEIRTLFDNYFCFKKNSNIKKSTDLIDVHFDKIYLIFLFHSQVLGFV